MSCYEELFKKIKMHSKYISMCDQSLSNASYIESLSHNKNVDSQVYEEESVINDVSSNCYFDSVVDDDDAKCNEGELKLSSIDELWNVHSGAVQIVPIDSDIFQRNFTPEEHFMINLCHICDEANAPFDLVDKIVGVVRDAQCVGLNMQSNVIHSQEYF